MKKQIPKEKIDTETAFQRHKSICDRELLRRRLLAENIHDLVHMFDNQEYKAILGFDPPPKWSGYLGLVEIYYSRAEVERWRKIYQCFVKDHNYDLNDIIDVPETRLEEITRIASDKAQIDELLGRARTNDSQSWRDSMAELSGKPTSYECQHSNKVYVQCTKCGEKHPVETGAGIPDEHKN